MYFTLISIFIQLTKIIEKNSNSWTMDKRETHKKEETFISFVAFLPFVPFTFIKRNMETTVIGKWLIWLGIGSIVVGSLLWLGSQIGIPLGSLPGDIRITKSRYAIYIPIVSCIVVSVILTLFLNLIFWLFRK